METSLFNVQNIWGVTEVLIVITGVVVAYTKLGSTVKSQGEKLSKVDKAIDGMGSKTREIELKMEQIEQAQSYGSKQMDEMKANQGDMAKRQENFSNKLGDMHGDIKVLVDRQNRPSG